MLKWLLKSLLILAIFVPFAAALAALKRASGVKTGVQKACAGRFLRLSGSR